MRYLKLALLVFLLPVAAHAQSDVDITEGSVKMGKKKMWAFGATYRYNKDVTASVMSNNMEAAGMKRSSHKKGVNKYKAAIWPELSSAKGDYYYKIKSRKGKTTVYIVASKGYDNYVTSSNDAAMAGKITQYMQRLDGQIARDISLQEKETEMNQIAAQNAKLAKELNAGQEQQAKAAKEVKALRSGVQTAPAAVK